jgi:hypothetical protein
MPLNVAAQISEVAGIDFCQNREWSKGVSQIRAARAGKQGLNTDEMGRQPMSVRLD